MHSFIKVLTLCAVIAYCSGDSGNGKEKTSVPSKTSKGGSKTPGNIQCYTCTGTPSQCYNTTSSTTCNGNGQFVCSTEYTNYGSQVTLRCFNGEACANQEKKNAASCYTSHIDSTSTCTFCCKTPFCNSVPVTTTTPATTITTTPQATTTTTAATTTTLTPETTTTTPSATTTTTPAVTTTTAAATMTTTPVATTTTSAATTTTPAATSTTTTAASAAGYTCEAGSNPCTPENIAAGLFYFPSVVPTKFIQCSTSGQCFVMACGPGTVWNQSLLTCAWPA